MRRALAAGLLLLASTCWAATTPGATSIADGSDILSSILPAETTAINLLPDGPIILAPNDFNSDNQECGSRQVLRALYDGFAIPAAPQHVSLLLGTSGASCQAVGGKPGVLLGLQGVDVALDCAKMAVGLSSPGSLDVLQYKLPSDLVLPGELTLVLSFDLRAPSLSLCINGQPAALDATKGASLLSTLTTTTSLLTSGLTIGARSDAQRSASATITHLWLADAPLPCSAGAAGLAGLPGVLPTTITTTTTVAVPAIVQALRAAAAANAPPQITRVTQKPVGDVFVGDPVQLTASATDDDRDDLRLSLTFYGLPPADCTAAQCGNRREESSAAGGSGSLVATVAYPRPGRYIIRVQVSDMRGGVVTADHAIIVRKQGDAYRRAPCCRHSSYVTAQQLGRPIHDTQFRTPALTAMAAKALGWSREYMQGDDMEAERLFDFGVLAPPAPTTPLQVVTCQDTRLAGAGSPVLYGATDASRAETHGHAKRLVIIPEAFPWASASQVSCQQHWSGWQAQSPFGVMARNGELCSVGCSRKSTELLIQNTGMFDQYNQALIQASYGQLSLNPQVQVLDELTVPFAPLEAASDNFTFYEAPALKVLAEQKVDYWLYMVLAPLANHRVPPFRAWSGGMSAKNAVMTTCYPTMYYATHETGHRLGFRHANIYKVDRAPAAPADPLGPGKLTTDGYSAPLDGMAAGKGDFGLYNRLMAGWLGGAERRTLSSQHLARQEAHRLMLWPFDRSESRGNLMAVTFRRSADEILVVGFRSTPHWQDVRVASNGAAGPLAPEEMRSNVAGVSVEVVRRDPATGAWSEAGLLDFNMLHGDWPHALPAQPGAFPRMGHFALLKPGYSWYDAPSRMLLALESVGDCHGLPGLPLYNHTTKNFYGYRGESSGWEFAERADYTGFASLECAQLVIKTGAAPPSGKLRFSVEIAQPGSIPGEAAPGIVPAGASPAGSASVAAARRRLQQAGGQAGSCGAPLEPTVTLRFADAVDTQSVASVVWRDALNRTLAAGPGLTTIKLRAMINRVAESSSSPAWECSGESCPDTRTYYVHVLSSDGRHTQARITFGSVSLGGVSYTVQYKYFELGALSFSEDSRRVAFPWPEAAGEAPVGRVLYRGPGLRLRSAELAVASAQLPPTSCARQWSLTMQLDLEGPLSGQAGSIISVDGSYPAVSLGEGRVAGKKAVWVQWGGYSRQVEIPDQTATSAHLVLTRDGDRLGVWLDGQGGWVMEDVWCMPSRDSITYCDHGPTGAGYNPPQQIRVCGGGGEAVDATAAWVRFYSYALPPEDIPAEQSIASAESYDYFRLSDGSQAASAGSSTARTGSKGSGNMGLLIAVIGAGAGVGVVAVALVVLWVCMRRHARRVAEAGIGTTTPGGSEKQLQGGDKTVSSCSEAIITAIAAENC